jgi:site-specific DNA-adenine methylase
MTSRSVPPLKWPGGKRWLGAHHSDLLCIGDRRLVEPFAGCSLLPHGLMTSTLI